MHQPLLPMRLQAEDRQIRLIALCLKPQRAAIARVLPVDGLSRFRLA